MNRFKSLLNCLLFLIILQTISLKAQTNQFIDTVYFFNPGLGQNTGQSSEYFPLNIFGPPSSKASSTIPESSPTEILSLGLDGEIIVGFKNSYLIDGIGVDFIIFENAFINPIKNKVFAEPAVVSVSEDGVNFVEFPFDSLTLDGCAGKTPTNGSANPFKIEVSGGDGFDLEKVGLKKAKYIKIKDISKIIKDNPNHPFYDPTISGFDLDAVAGIYVVPEQTGIQIQNKLNKKYLNICVYNYLGQKIDNFSDISVGELKNKLDKGFYILVLSSPFQVETIKLCID